ncbi:MAG: Na+/H+ antiporter NhaC, partial [Halieaceae bacterium]
CDHIEHVRTQMPYALLVSTVIVVVCLEPVGYGLPWWMGLLLASLLLIWLLRILGKRSSP